MLKFKIITHFEVEDEECSGEYTSVEILDEKGNSIVKYGDYYHDKGRQKAEAFLDGLKFALQEDIEKEYEYINDEEY